MSLEKQLSTGDQGEEMANALAKLGFAPERFGQIFAALAGVADLYCRAHAEQPPATIASVRNGLRQLADCLRAEADVPLSLSAEVWLALLGRYPGSNLDLEPYSADSFAGKENAFPSDLAASKFIIKGFAKQPGMAPFAHARDSRWQAWTKSGQVWNGYGAVLVELFRVTGAIGLDDPLLDEIVLSSEDCVYLAHQASRFDLAQRQKLAFVVDWAIKRVEKTCIPRGNPGRRRVECWANIGTPETTAICRILEVLWPWEGPDENFPAQLEMSELSVIVDGVLSVGAARSRQHDHLESVQSAGDGLIRSAVVVRRNLALYRRQLLPIWERMLQLDNINAALFQKCGPLLSSGCGPKSSRRTASMRRRLKKSIAKNSAETCWISAQHGRLNDKINECRRRLEFGDLAGSRAGPRITGWPTPL